MKFPVPAVERWSVLTRRHHLRTVLAGVRSRHCKKNVHQVHLLGEIIVLPGRDVRFGHHLLIFGSSNVQRPEKMKGG